MSKVIVIFAVIFVFYIIEGQGYTTVIGGCAGTQQGCAPGQREAELERRRNSATIPFIGGCAGTLQGCAPGQKEAELERRKSKIYYITY